MQRQRADERLVGRVGRSSAIPTRRCRRARRGATSPRTASRGSARGRTSSAPGRRAPRPPGRRRAPPRARPGIGPRRSPAPAPAGDVEVAADHRRHPQPLDRVGVEALQPAGDHLADVLGQAEALQLAGARVLRRTPESARWRTISSMKNGLPSVSRYSACTNPRDGVPPARRRDQLDRLCLRQPADVQLAHQPVPAQPGQRGLEALAPPLDVPVGAEDRARGRTAASGPGGAAAAASGGRPSAGRRARSAPAPTPRSRRADRRPPRTAGSGRSRGRRGRAAAARAGDGAARAAAGPARRRARARRCAAPPAARGHVVAERLQERLEGDHRLLRAPGRRARSPRRRARAPRSRPAAGSCRCPGRRRSSRTRSASGVAPIRPRLPAIAPAAPARLAADQRARRRRAAARRAARSRRRGRRPVAGSGAPPAG